METPIILWYLRSYPLFLYFRNMNVVDNMLKLLERHNVHLEELVSERTRELVEEQKKVETLLHNILPKYV